MIWTIGWPAPLPLFLILTLAVLATTAAAVTLAAAGLDDTSQHIDKGHGYDAEYHDGLNYA